MIKNNFFGVGNASRFEDRVQYTREPLSIEPRPEPGIHHDDRRPDRAEIRDDQKFRPGRRKRHHRESPTRSTSAGFPTSRSSARFRYDTPGQLHPSVRRHRPPGRSGICAAHGMDERPFRPARPDGSNITRSSSIPKPSSPSAWAARACSATIFPLRSFCRSAATGRCAARLRTGFWTCPTSS